MNLNKSKVFYVPVVLVEGIFRKPQTYIRRFYPKDLPETAVLREVHHCWDRDAFAFIYFDESFPETPAGERFPEIVVCDVIEEVAK